MMRPAILLLLAVFFVVSVGAAQEQDQEQELPDGPFVRIEAEPETATVGQPVKLRVTVLAPTWFPEAPIWPSFEIANAIVMLPADSSRSISERVGRDNWAGVARNYRFYPQLAGEYHITGQSIDVTYADPQTRQPIELSLEVPDTVITSTVPAGAESLNPLLIGTSLTLTQEVAGVTDDLKAGDAVVRTVTADIDGMPAMFLPPLIQPLQDDGLSALVRQPVVEDMQDKRTGTITGAAREESVSYVFEKGGDFTLPAIELSWWNTETEAIETASVPEVALNVASPPGATDSEASVASAGPTIMWLTVGAAFLIVAAVVIFLARHRVRAWRTARHARYLTSEAYAFRCLEKSVGHGNLSDVDRHLEAWLARARFGPDHADALAGVREIMARAFDQRFAPGRHPAALSDQERRDLQAALSKARDQLRHNAPTPSGQGLPPRLNPAL